MDLRRGATQKYLKYVAKVGFLFLYKILGLARQVYWEIIYDFRSNVNNKILKKLRDYLSAPSFVSGF